MTVYIEFCLSSFFHTFQPEEMEEAVDISSYLCYHCVLNGSFEEVITHSTEAHRGQPLKCRQLILDTSTGK